MGTATQGQIERREAAAKKHKSPKEEGIPEPGGPVFSPILTCDSCAFFRPLPPTLATPYRGGGKLAGLIGPVALAGRTGPPNAPAGTGASAPKPGGAGCSAPVETGGVAGVVGVIMPSGCTPGRCDPGTTSWFDHSMLAAPPPVLSRV